MTERQRLLRDVAVLVGYVLMEVNSHTAPSTAATRLMRDVRRIPDRFAGILQADDRRRWQRKVDRKAAR